MSLDFNEVVPQIRERLEALERRVKKLEGATSTPPQTQNAPKVKPKP